MDNNITTLLTDYDLILLNEAANNNTLKVELLDIEKFIKVNNCKEVTDPVFFNGPTPTPQGLLSNEIFGITKAERSGIYAYIDLGGTFLHPLIYKALFQLNSEKENLDYKINFAKVTISFELEEEADYSILYALLGMFIFGSIIAITIIIVVCTKGKRKKR